MLSRKIHGPRKVVLGWDPAVDSDASDLVAYKDSGWDFDSGHLKIRAGETPTVWTLGPLTEAQKRRAKAFDVDSPDWTDFVFRCGIHGVTNYLIQDVNGEREVSQVVRKDVPGLGEMATVEWLESSKFVLDDLWGLAMIVWQMSEARAPL